MKGGLLALAFMVTETTARAGETAAEIFRKSQELGMSSLLDLTTEVRVTTIARDGTKAEQIMIATAHRVGGKIRSLTRILSPPDLAGLAILTIEGAPGEGDEIAVYLPKLKRVRKLARSQRGDTFLQTEFNFADIGSTGGAVEPSFSCRAEQQLGDMPVFVLNGKASPESPYGEITAYVEQATYMPVRVEYADKTGKLWKVYHALRLQKFKDHLLPFESVMENVQTGARTVLQILSAESSKLGDDAFTERALERG